MRKIAMNHNQKRPRLALRRETVQLLAQDKLDAVHGGRPTSNTTSLACPTSLDSACTC